MFKSCFLILIAALVSKITFAADNPKGVIVYKEHPDAPALLTYAVEYSKIKVFELVINAIPVSQDRARRFMTKNVVSIIPYIDLETARITSEGEAAQLISELEALTRVAKEFPTARGNMSDRISQLNNAISAFNSGLVLRDGNWIRKDAESDPKLGMNSEENQVGKIALKDRILHVPRLTGISKGRASIRHSSGYALLPISDLTDEQIELLNKTSTDVQIRRELMSAVPSEASDNQSVSPSQPTVTGVNLPSGNHQTSAHLDPESFLRKVNLFLPTLLESAAVSASDDWRPLSAEDRMNLKKLINRGAILRSGNTLNQKLAHAQQMLIAFEKCSDAAGFWIAKDGVKAVTEYFRIEFPANFDETEQFADAWRTLASLQRDLEQRHQVYQDRRKEIQNLANEDSPRTSVLEKTITELLEEFPDIGLEEQRKELRKNSLGL